MNAKHATIILFLLLCPSLTQAQEQSPEERYLRSRIEQRTLDRERWSEITEGVDYTEKKRKPPKQKPDGTGDESGNGAINRIFNEGVGATLARFMLITIGVVLIALLVRSILGYGGANNKKIKRENEALNIRKIEENLHEADLADYIQQAVDAGDFNLAIRLYYLAVLKELSLQKSIKWKIDKTNSEYLREMRNTPHFADFRSLTLIFEKSWYGDQSLNGSHFATLEPLYRRFLDQLPAAPQAMTP